jgi:hypothetical protein
MRIVVFLMIAAIMAGLPAGPAKAADDDLKALYRQVLRNPTDTEINLRYARLAEERGKPRLALAAYERMLVNDPTNEEVKRGMQRIRYKLHPDQTQYSASLGGIWESNPRYDPANQRGELQALASLAFRDERKVGDQRWRTTGSVAGWFHQHESDMNYLHAGILTGPIFNVAPEWSLHLGAGGSAAYFDHRFFYSEAIASATFESALEGAYRAIQIRGAYRNYDNSLYGEGFYADATGRFRFPDVIGSGSLLYWSPWVRWSDISGSSFSLLTNEAVQPGAYVEWGSRTELFKTLASWLVAGPTFSIYQRFYRDDFIPFTTTKRRDLFIVPGATVMFPNLLGFQKGLRIDYKYIDDNSNDPNHKFHDHAISATVYARF